MLARWLQVLLALLCHACGTRACWASSHCVSQASCSCPPPFMDDCRDGSWLWALSDQAKQAKHVHAAMCHSMAPRSDVAILPFCWTSGSWRRASSCFACSQRDALVAGHQLNFLVLFFLHFVDGLLQDVLLLGAGIKLPVTSQASHSTHA